jgi:hydrogenase expression/formation protein HypC
MCLGVPMRIVSIEGIDALCDAQGVRRRVSLFMVQDDGLAPGDHVMVHVGYALRRISEGEARSVWDLLEDAGGFA